LFTDSLLHGCSVMRWLAIRVYAGSAGLVLVW
jgi:hypothetical protein